jgi:hypothetical protein
VQRVVWGAAQVETEAPELSGQKVTHEAPSTSGIKKVEKITFFCEDGIFFAKLAFSEVIYVI